jgi:hypothetical protein
MPGPLRACHERDLLQREAPLPAGGTARCARCGAVLYRNPPDGLDRTLADALGAAVTIEAPWTIRRAGGAMPRTGRWSVHGPVSGGGFDALVAAHGRAAARRSSDIAGAIRAP